MNTITYLLKTCLASLVVRRSLTRLITFLDFIREYSHSHAKNSSSFCLHWPPLFALISHPGSTAAQKQHSKNVCCSRRVYAAFLYADGHRRTTKFILAWKGRVFESHFPPILCNSFPIFCLAFLSITKITPKNSLGSRSPLDWPALHIVQRFFQPLYQRLFPKLNDLLLKKHHHNLALKLDNQRYRTFSCRPGPCSDHLG